MVLDDQQQREFDRQMEMPIDRRARLVKAYDAANRAAADNGMPGAADDHAMVRAALEAYDVRGYGRPQRFELGQDVVFTDDRGLETHGSVHSLGLAQFGGGALEPAVQLWIDGHVCDWIPASHVTVVSQ